MTRRTAGWIIALATTVALALSAHAKQDDAPKQYALVVGINNYTRPEVNPLRYAVADANALAQTLKDIGFDKVFVLTSDKEGDDAPTRSNIIFRLGWLRDNLRPQDSLVFFFSGHGMYFDNQTFLLAQDSDPRTIDTLQATACPPQQVNDILRAIKAKRMLVMYDACRSNPKADKGAEDNLMRPGTSKGLNLSASLREPSQSTQRIVATLLACSDGERSYEWNDKKHGFFTYCLIEGLRGKAAPAGKPVTLASLVPWVIDHVEEAAHDAGLKQSPHVEWGYSHLDWVLARGPTTTALPAAQDEPAPRRTQPQPRKPEQHAWERVTSQTTPETNDVAVTQPAVKRPHTESTPTLPSFDSRVVGVWRTSTDGYGDVFVELTSNGRVTYYTQAYTRFVPFARGQFATANNKYVLKIVEASSNPFGLYAGFMVRGDYLVEARTLRTTPSSGALAGQTTIWQRFR